MPRRSQEGGDLCAIFIHAGAGYHSHANERIHLTAVNDAAKVGMAVLKNGGDATDAVEMAIRLLEDKEITNAGYGSNLTMDGQVECDATMVDYLGRSGAVGAISQVKNPIVVARLVLEESTKPLSLQRVPPNLLVGAGATDYAADKGVPVLPPDFLVSVNARERWLRWRQDLRDADEKEARRLAQAQARTENPTEWEDVHSAAAGPGFSSANSTASTSTVQPRPGLSALPALVRPLVASTADVPTLARPGDDGTIREPMESGFDSSDQQEDAMDDTLPWIMSPPKRQRMEGSFDGLMGEDYKDLLQSSSSSDTLTGYTHHHDDGRDDEITDTVGAIAVDCFGHIAAGSSSGGIGMKHRGRCGPAALVGIGTAVLPADPQDATQTCVATVTSGTGEHMATTTAAATAADRIYSSMRKENGRLMPCNEDEAMRGVIEHDFMAHPGVVHSHCTGAIGILGVKKCRDGIYFYFGHNTDSFAIASMHSEERKPVCTMSRSRGQGAVAQGGRLARSKHARIR
ncbi:taspase [Exophiala viscosa]|uniref:taspase n=1 Tax=Exophiala viscosa TaxID=2486360 RepID=UPI00218DE105|nr:taspase [Exophiala viscosa]